MNSVLLLGTLGIPAGLSPGTIGVLQLMNHPALWQVEAKDSKWPALEQSLHADDGWSL